ncbi:hypothetical protein UP10_33895 [Bradyrhizobium sp. LTSPM299]|jgi:hypothetical protein|nr:hypothetical protein UP10_33895 [Bradyrhizobium sp. LTSPM299]
MGMLATGIVALGISLAAGGVCRAQFEAPGRLGHAPVVNEEPPEGKMAPGMVLLVDDGSCGKGRVKQVTGGEIAGFDARPRTRRCIPRPTR